MDNRLIGFIFMCIMYLTNIIITNLHVTTVKTKVKKNNLEELDSVLPDYILVAEKLGFKDGESKLNYVVNLATLWLSKKLKKPIEQVTEKYSDYIVLKIEKLLSLPQKKETDKND